MEGVVEAVSSVLGVGGLVTLDLKVVGSRMQNRGSVGVCSPGTLMQAI